MKHLLNQYDMLVSILLAVCPFVMGAQSVNLGNPPVLNFHKNQYKAGTQSWDIAQSKDGVLWFANNDGLLEFDGLHWRLHPLDNATIVRSVQADEQSANIYVGGQGDFGYFSPNDQGVLVYHSLKDLIPEEGRHFGDVWDVLVRPEGAFFRTDHQVFRYFNGQVSLLFPAGSSLHFMGVWDNRLLVQDGNLRLFVLENGAFRPLGQPDVFEHGTISAVIRLSPDTLLVTTIKNGIFYYTGGNTFQPWPTRDDAFLIDNRIFCAGLLPDGKIAIGTSLNGLVTIDRQRRIFHHVNKKSGLQNNTVLSLLSTAKGGVWLGLDNGVDFVDLNSPVTTFFPDGELQGTGYTAGIYRDKIYFGTNTGLYAADWKPYYRPSERQKFTQVQHSEGQVWSLSDIGGQLLMGHHEGAFAIEGLSARQLTKLQGIWKFVPWSDELTVAGHYNGLCLFKKTGTGWAFQTVLNGFSESSRILAKDRQGDIWMAHPYRGIYRIAIHPETARADATFFGTAQGLPSDLGNHLFQLGENIIFAGEKGVYRYDTDAGRMIPDEQFTRIFGEKTRVKYLRADNDGNIWYATEHETGLLLIENNALNKNVRRLPIPELSDKLTGGFPFILPVDRQNVFMATGQGFIHFNPAAYLAGDSLLRLVLHEVRIKGTTDSLLFGGHLSEGMEPRDVKLSHLLNTLEFTFSSPDYPGGESVRFAHYLEGAETGWSDWDVQSKLVFTNLHPGEYVFHVKARNQHGVESEVYRFRFTIMPPWYASRLANVLYALFVLGLIAWYIYRQQRRFEKEKHDLQTRHRLREEEHQLNALRSEEVINRLKNEKLEAEVQHKTKELASATMHLVQKNEILNAIRGSLEKLERKMNATPEHSREIGRIIKMMEQDASTDADWEHFTHNFDQVHTDFLKRIGEQYAHLSPNDYKLCVYLRMNLSSKEIATLMNISIRGVEASRYRLRKRLGLDTEQNLTEYLMRF